MENDNIIILHQRIVREFFKRIYSVLFLYASLVNYVVRRKKMLFMARSRPPITDRIYLRVRVNVLLTELYPTKEVLCEQSSNSVDFSLDIDDYLMAVQKMSIDGILDDFTDTANPHNHLPQQQPSSLPSVIVPRSPLANSIVSSPSPARRSKQGSDSEEDGDNEEDRAVRSILQAEDDLMNGVIIMEKDTNLPLGNQRPSQSLQQREKSPPLDYSIEMKENHLPCAQLTPKILKKDTPIPYTYPSPYPLYQNNLPSPPSSSNPANQMMPSGGGGKPCSTSKASSRKQFLSTKILLDDYLDDDLDRFSEDKDEGTTISSVPMSEDDEPFEAWDNSSLNADDQPSTSDMSISFKSNRLSRRRDSRKMHNSRSESDVRSLENYRIGLSSPKDASLLSRNRIPFTYEHVATCSNEEFRQMRSTPGLSNAQINILVDARRRATNRQAAERCRRIKVMAREQLLEKLEGLKNVKNELMRSIASARQRRVKLKDELYDEQKRLLSALTLEDGRRLGQSNWRVHVSTIDTDQPSSSRQSTHEVVITPTLAIQSTNRPSHQPSPAATTHHQRPSFRKDQDSCFKENNRSLY